MGGGDDAAGDDTSGDDQTTGDDGDDGTVVVVDGGAEGGDATTVDGGHVVDSGHGGSDGAVDSGHGGGDRVTAGGSEAGGDAGDGACPAGPDAGSLLPLCPPDAGAPTSVGSYIVSSSGSDSNPGTIGVPFATVQHCANVAQPGDTCYLRAGTYRESVVPPTSGTAARRPSWVASLVLGVSRMRFRRSLLHGTAA